MTISLGFKQKFILDIMKKQGFITDENLKKLKVYSTTGQIIATMKSLEIKGFVKYNEKENIWEVIQSKK